MLRFDPAITDTKLGGACVFLIVAVYSAAFFTAGMLKGLYVHAMISAALTGVCTISFWMLASPRFVRQTDLVKEGAKDVPYQARAYKTEQRLTLLMMLAVLALFGVFLIGLFDNNPVLAAGIAGLIFGIMVATRCVFHYCVKNLR